LRTRLLNRFALSQPVKQNVSNSEEKNMKRLLFAFSLVLSSTAFAGTQFGNVSYVVVRSSDGLVYFTVGGDAKVGAPSCATVSYWIIRDENSNAGKQQYAMVLAAQASGKRLSVVGRNTCARWGDGEDVDYILSSD
jgi:hypothetical protein